MSKASYILLAAIVLGIFSLGNAQYTEEQNVRRWLRKKPIIDSISIEGNSFFTDARIKTSLFSRRSSIILALKADRRRRVQRETVMRDTSEAKFLYLSSGFLGVRLKEEFVPLPPDSNALVSITIDEGRRFFHSHVDLTGDYDRQFDRYLFKIKDRFKEGRPVDLFKLRQAGYDIKSVLANHGYPYARTTFRIDTTVESDRAGVTFIIESDSLVHFGDINIVGADRFDTSLVRRELTFEPGDIYRRKDIIDSQERLLHTGYYLTLRLHSAVSDTSQSAQRLNPGFSLTLKEKRAHYVSLKTGAAQDSIKDLTWSLSGSWGKRNFLKSRLLEISARSLFVIFTEWRLKEHSYRVRITEPWFIGIRMPLTLTGQIEPGVRSLVQPYRKQTWYVSANTVLNRGERFRIITGFQYEQVNIYGVSKEAEEQIREEKGISIRRKLYINAVRDSRENVFIPSQGSLTSFRIEYIGGFLGGDDSFYLLEGSWSRYQRVWPGWISASRLRGGMVQETGTSTSVPTDDRFYIGGANTIRGFAENSMGPKSELGNPTGSDIIIIVNQEFRFPIFGKLWGSIFADFGNGYRYRADIKWNNLAVSYGIGLQFISPAGPIRLDYARRIRTKGIEPDDKFHFTILYAF
ncbi:MAG: BamA/TamA family outer membrane protein [Candidatus Zixiibacteriota bacterium]|nr:MAG: BamA/TamA family outer membrane protein [candidate division Zixibacteria bacterium]